MDGGSETRTAGGFSPASSDHEAAVRACLCSCYFPPHLLAPPLLLHAGRLLLSPSPLSKTLNQQTTGDADRQQGMGRTVSPLCGGSGRRAKTQPRYTLSPAPSAQDPVGGSFKPRPTAAAQFQQHCAAAVEVCAGEQGGGLGAVAGGGRCSTCGRGGSNQSS